MIVGHLATVALVHRWRPRAASPWWLVPACVAPDLLDIGYALAGFCNPLGLYSHTLPLVLLLAATLGGAAALSGRRETGALVALVVLLHLPLDYVTGNKLFWPGGDLHGLRLYARPLADFLVEGALLLGGWLLVRGRPLTPRWAASAWTVAALLVLQGAVDTVAGGLKPSACAASSGRPATLGASWRFPPPRPPHAAAVPARPS